MKLHLPKGLRSAVLACMAVVGGFATTVGTGVIAGGAITIAFSIPQAQADMTWKGGTGDKATTDWANIANWEYDSLADNANLNGNGPGTSGSNMWAPINVGADERVTFGSGDSRVGLEGWNLNLNLEKNATLYATTSKFQGTTAISVNNDSHLYLKHNNGHFEASTINIGANSSVTLQITADKDNGAMTLNLNDSTSKMTFTADAAYTLRGAVNVKSVALSSVEQGTWGTKDLGLTLQNVTLNNLNIDLGEGWTRSSVEITEDNYEMFGGMYSIIVEDGVYKLAYSTAAALTACEWTGGDLSWGVGSAFTGATTFANGAEVSFTTANANVTLTSNVLTKHLSVAENVEVGISGEYKVTALDVAVASGAKLGLSTVGNALGTVDLSAGGTLVLSPGKEATLAEVIGADTVINGGTLTISGAGTNITSTGNKLAGVVVNVDGGTLTFNEAFINLLQKDVTVSNGGKIKVTVDGSGSVNDLCAWTTNQNISILSGGELDLGTTRFSFGGNNNGRDKIVLNNGTLTGAGSLEGGAHAGVTLHVFSSVEMEASNGSILAANARIQSGNILTINTTADGVDAPALTISGAKDAGFLKNEGTLKKVGDGTLVISTSCTDSAGVIIAEAGTLAIKGTDTSVKNITVTDGATLALDGAVTLTGTNHLAGILSITDTATLAGVLTLGDTAEIDLSDWVGGDTYQLFNLGEGASITPATVKVAGFEGTWMLNVDGALVESADLHWLGGDLTWNADTEFEGGKLIPTSVVTFNGDAGDVKATVEGALVTTILSVEEGTNLILSGEGTLASTETYVAGEMTVGTTGNSFGTVEIGSDGTLTIGAAGNSMSSVEMGTDASLVIATGGTTTLADSIGTTNISGGTLGVATGTTLEVAGEALNNQKMDIAGELVISGCSLRADINISGKLTLNQGDGINYGANNTITVDGGELALGANRQTFGANNKLVLNNGTVTGAGDQHGAVDFYQDGGKITSTGTSSIEAPVRLRGSRQTTTMDVQDGTLTVSSVCNTGGGSAGNLSKIGAGTLAISGSLDTTGAVKINEGVLKMLNGSSATSAITLAGGSLAAEGTATMASLAGSGDITVAADGTLTITNVSCDSFTKKGAGTLAIGTLTGNYVSMNHEGTQTVGTYALAENAVLAYGKTGNLLKIDALTTAVAVDIFGIDISSGVSLNLGIASSVSKDLISVIGLESYELVDDNGYWKLTSAATALETDWDFNWGSKGLAGSPQTITEVAIAADQTAVAIGGVASITGGSANTLVYGGAIDGPFTGNSWIMAKAGTYNAIVGGNYANNWGGGTRADFNGNSHILVDGATVGYIIGGNYKDGQSAQFNGSSFISVFSGDVTGSIIGSGVVAHDSSAVHTGDTNIFIYTALNTSNANLPSGDNMGNLPKDMVIGGFAWGCNVSKGQTINGNTNITLDLTGYTGSATTFGKHLVGGSFNGQENSTQTITGSTNVTVNLGTLAMANGVKVVGGNWVNNGPSNIGATNVTLKGGTYNGAIAGGSWVNGGNKTHTIGSTNVTIEGGTFEAFVAGGTSLNVVSTAKTGAATMKLTGGIYKNVVTAGNYVGAEGSVSNQGDSTLTVSGGTFNGNVAVASYLGKRATSTSGTSTVTIADAAFTGWVTGGVFTNSSSSVVSIGDVNMSLTDSSFSKLVAGGTFVGGNSTTNTIGDVNIVLDGVTLTEGLYGGVYHYGEGATSTSTVGDVTITLTGDGTISGNIWAAGGINGNNANITVASTTVKVADTVAFADGVTLNAGFDKAATDSCVVAVTGDRSLIFTGNADQDRSTLAFAGFNKIGVETAGKTATIGALTATEAITIDGKGTIKLGGAATLTGGATIEGALDMNGQSVTGDVTVEGTLTSKGTSVVGTMTIDDAATLTDATAATNIVVDSYSNTKGLTATEAISVGSKLTSSAALTATKITGEGSVEITGGTVTLSDTTDAFANTGATSIAGATLAGTWTAGDVTIGAGVTASGTITLANSTINSTITATGSVALSGNVTVGVTGEEGDAFYTHNGTVDAAGNGFKSASTDYALVNGTSTAAEGTNWLIDGTTATNATYANGTLTVKTNADAATYWVNTGIVSYDGAKATYDGTEQSLADTTGIMLNGGTLELLELTTSSVDDISASDKGGTLNVNGQSITQAVFGTLEGTVALIGTGSYDLGTRVTALATNVALGTGWTGTVKMSDVTLGNDAYSAFAKTNLAVTGATITDKLVMNGGTLTLAGEMDVTGLSYETTVTWSSGEEGTGFSFTSREMKVVDTTAGGSIVKGDALSWKADGEYVFDFDTSDGVLAMNDAAWTTVYNIAAGDMARYSADVNDSDGKKFINTDGIAATSIVMNGSSLYMETGLADNLVDGGIVVNSTGNTISLLGSEVTLAKGSLSVQEGATVELVGNGGIYDLSADADNTTLGAGVSISSDWAGTVKMGDVTATGAVDLSKLGNVNSIVSGGAVSVGSLAGTAVNLEADSVALTTGASTLGTLTTGALTLGGADSVGSLAVGTLNVTSGVITFNQLDASLLAIDELVTSLNLDISESLLLTAVSQTESKSLKLMTVTDLDGKTITLNGGTSWDSADKQYTYKLDIIGGVVTITSKINGSVWAGDADSNTWSEGGSWSADTAPTVEDSVVFNGTGCREVIVSGKVTAQSVTIDVGAEIEAEDIETEIYEFVGGSTKDTLTIEKNLSVNKGTLVLAVNTSVAGRSEVVANAELDVIAGNLASQYGFNNAGTLNIGSTSQTSTLVSVVGGDMINTGTINNEASLIIGSGSPDAATAAPNLINSGTIASSGIIGVDGNLVNSGTGSLEQTGSSLMVRGTLNNSATVEVSGAATQVTLGAAVNSGTLNVKEGSVVIGASDEPGLIADGADVQNGDLDNSGGTITLGTDSTSASLTVNGDITGNAGGSITVMEGSTLTVTGDLNNAGGTLTLSGEDATAKIGGDLIMKDGASEGVLTVGQDASLTVDGKLAASEMMLEFGGNVTVGGDVEIGTLTNKGEFIANGSEDTEVHIGTLNNAAGTLTVGVMQNGVLTGGNLEIGTLTGTGVVNVGTDGSLTIDSETTFTGQLNNLGTLYITSTTLDSAQEEAGQTAGNITTEKLTITDQATGFEGDSYQLGKVATDTLVIDGTSSMDAGSTRLSMESLAAKTADGKVAIVLSDVEEMVRGTGDVTDSSYHLITTAPAADGTEAAPFLAGSIAEKLDLSRYGYDENGEYDATMASVQSDYMQHLLQQNKYVVFSDSDPLAGTATADVATGTADLYAAITELKEELSVWNLDGAHDMTEAGLTVLKGGKLVSDDILDNVQKVVVTGEQSLELTGKQELDSALDLSHVTLNNLTAGEGTPAILSITGDGSATDSATITTAADGFAGTLALSKVSADITGKVDTIEVGADLNAMLDVSDADINLGSRDATFGGDLKGGSINFGVGSKELGVSVMKGDLKVAGTAINVQQTDSAIVIGGVGLGDEKTVIADLDSTNGSAAVTLIGKGYDKYFENARLEGGKVVADRNDTYATDKIQPSTENGAAGAELLDNLLVEINPQATAPDSDMAALLDAVDTDRMSDETAAALAGSSISALGLALSGDVERQLRSIRNRTTTMGVNECVVNEGMPYFNAWFNTESNRTKLDSDSTNPGYTLDSWGGTVGFDVDVNPNFTMGLAISAMYGSITAEGPDSLDGDMDTYYLSLFARYADCAWTHTFVATLGKMDGSYSRTIPGWGATDASIDGTSFGLMYEVGYVIPLDEDGEACVQPIFNVMLRHSSVGSFTEDGDLGLDVDKQGMTTLTFGLGARMQAVVGESVYNRASIFEGRILAKADLGDRQSEADVSLVNGGCGKATVKSAELGTIGLELGAGLTIPLGDDDGSLFFDASVELRSGYTDVNGTVGYRINF